MVISRSSNNKNPMFGLTQYKLKLDPFMATPKKYLRKMGVVIPKKQKINKQNRVIDFFTS